MFRDKYRNAYDCIQVKKLNVEELLQRTEEKKTIGKRLFQNIYRIAVPLLSLCLIFMLVMPVMAKEIPGVYHVIQKYAPELTDYVLPEETLSISNGIILQMEAVNIKENKAEVILSFRDEEGSEKNQIHGEVDLYDSFRIKNYGETSAIGGCSFLEYDSAMDKAYFKIDITSDKDFSKNKIRFSVSQLLTNHVEEERYISLENMIENPQEKIVELNGIGGIGDRSKIPFLEKSKGIDNRIARVMDEVELNEDLLTTLQITGIAYEQGILRVQQCRGNFQESDRHIRLFLKNGEGMERMPDASVSWKEEIEGEKVLFDETWFLITEEELNQYELYGTFYITDGSVKGNWEVIVDLKRG